MSRTIVVTGGAGGIGRCIVEYFASQGDAVYFVDCDVQGVHTQMERMRGYGWQVTGYAGDVAEKQVLEDFARRVLDEHPEGIHCLVNNACLMHGGILEGCDYDDFLYVQRVGVAAPYMLSKLFKDHFQGLGSIVNLSSVTGPLVADSGEVAYATTKAALLGFTKGLAAELVEKGIRVNAILPGYIMTPMVEGIAKDSNSNDPNSVVDGIADGIPMKRLGTIEELGELAAFLASNEASYITGQSFVIDGGSTLPETMSVGV